MGEVAKSGGPQQGARIAGGREGARRSGGRSGGQGGKVDAMAERPEVEGTAGSWCHVALWPEGRGEQVAVVVEMVCVAVDCVRVVVKVAVVVKVVVSVIVVTW